MGSMTEPNLRVSVAALARVLLDDPESGQTLLVLERTATLREQDGGSQVIVRAKPFGGGVVLRDVGALQAAIGIVLEAQTSRTDSPRAPGVPTVRIYNVYEARLNSPDLIEIPIDQRGGPLQIGGHPLAGNVPAILPEVETRKYSRPDLRGF